MGVSIFSNTLLNLMGLVPVDTKLSESHSPTATVANFALEDGSKVSDHIIVNPPIIEIEFMLASQDVPFGLVAASYGLTAALKYNLLVRQLEKRTLYTILTRHKLYTNMAFLELPAEHTGPFQGQLVGRAKMQQINKAKLATVSVPQSQLENDDTQFQASSPTNFGTLLLRTTSLSEALGTLELVDVVGI